MANLMLRDAFPLGTFLSLKQEHVAPRTKLPGMPSEFVIIVYRDICADCGRERVTKVEKIVPVSMVKSGVFGPN